MKIDNLAILTSLFCFVMVLVFYRAASKDRRTLRRDKLEERIARRDGIAASRDR